MEGVVLNMTGLPPNLTANDYYDTLKQPTHMIIIYGLAYGLIFLSAIIGNVMVIVVVVTTPCLHTQTNLFIANLAVADVLVAIFCIPITFLHEIYSGWPFGPVLCKMTPYIQGVAVCVSVYNLAAIAIDRLLAICFNPQMRIMRRGACLILCLIWVFSFALMLPWLIYFRQFDHGTGQHSVPVCHEVWPDFPSQQAYFFVAIFLGTYLLPLLVTFSCYLLIAWRVWHRRAPGVAMGNGVIKHGKLNVIKMLVTVVVMFTFSWLPLHTMYLILYFSNVETGVVTNIFEIGMPLAHWLELSNSGMNAFIYSFFSGNFRRGFLRLWYCLRGKTMPPRGSTMSLRATRTMSEDSGMETRYSLIHRSKHQQTNGSIRREQLQRQLAAAPSNSPSWSSVKNRSTPTAPSSSPSWSSGREPAFV